MARPTLPLVTDEACCSTVTGGAMEVEAAERLATSFKALSDRPGCGCCR